MEKTRRLGLAAAVTLAAILALAATVGLDGRRDQGTPPRRPAAIIGGEDAPSTEFPYGARRRLKDQDSFGSDNSRAWDASSGLSPLSNNHIEFGELLQRSGGGAAAVTSTPLEGQIQGLEARVTAIEKYLQATHGNSRAWDAVKALKILIGDDRRGGGGAPVASTTVEDQIQGLQDRVAVIELYLQAAGGSGNSRQQIHKLLQMLTDSDGGSR